MESREEFAARLRDYRIEFGATQLDMAMELGIDKSTYAHYETGRRTPDIERLIKIAKFFNLNDDLLGVKSETTILPSHEKKYYRFPIVVSQKDRIDFDISRVYPLQQKKVFEIHNALVSDSRVGSAFLFGSSITSACHSESDIDLAIKIKPETDVETAKDEVSEIVQEICDWKADILWRDRLTETDRVLGEILKGVKIA